MLQENLRQNEFQTVSFYFRYLAVIVANETGDDDTVDEVLRRTEEMESTER